MSMTAWRYYKTRINELLSGHDYDTTPHPEVLKTDVFNEIKNLPEVGGVTATDCPVTFVYVDIDREYLDTFKGMYPSERAHLMDIRDLQFSGERFDFIFDCSTIDHIPFTDVEDVLLSYRGLLKPTGKLLLISWTAGEVKTWPPKSRTPGQYYHPRIDLESILREYFTVIDVEDDIIPPDKYGTLISYTLKKEA